MEAGLTAVARAERTLRVWRLSESEIEPVKQEAERIRARKGQRDPEQEKTWARVEVRAPLDGVVVEKNVAVGDIIDTTTDLFKIANVDSLTVWANAYEENLPALLDLPPEKLRWTVRVNADPALAPLQGPHRQDRLRQRPGPAYRDGDGPRGQSGRAFAGRAVHHRHRRVAPSAQEVVVPASALVEDGRDSIVFVQPDRRNLAIRCGTWPWPGGARARSISARCSSRRRPHGACRQFGPASGSSPARPSSCVPPWRTDLRHNSGEGRRTDRR